MGSRYLAVAGGTAELHRGLVERTARSGSLAVAIDRPGLLVLVEAGGRCVSLAPAGLILGALFTPGRAGPIAELREDVRTAIVASRGRHLVDAYWGGYVAFLADPAAATVDIVRAPFGELPCLHCRIGNAIAIASDVGLLGEFVGFKPTVRWDALARHLAAGDLRRDETCLDGLSELRGGDCLETDAGAVRIETLWSPWKQANPTLRLNDKAEAIRRLRDSARYCVKTRLAAFDRSLLLLSGGVDSSIVAACLAHAGSAFDCLNIVTANPTGDERSYALPVAQRVGAPLVERMREISRIDVTRSAAAHLPRPVSRLFEQDSQMLVEESCRDLGAAVAVDGGGGDNLFCSLQSVAPVADCLLAQSEDAKFWRMAGEIGALAETSVWTVARHAWLRAWRGPRHHRWKPDLRFLTRDAAALAPQAVDHPWLDAPDDALPGKAAHIALLIAAQGLAEDADPQVALPSVSALVSQPLVETCLRIPTWHWFERGRNRAVARRAFEAELPPEIIWRRSKGTPDSFVVEIYEQHRALVRGLLRNGALAGHGVIDIDAVTDSLDDPSPPRGQDFVRILQLLDAEIWARSQTG